MQKNPHSLSMTSYKSNGDCNSSNVKTNVSSCKFIKQMIVYTVQFQYQVLLHQKELTQTNNNSLCWKPEPYSLPTQCPTCLPLFVLVLSSRSSLSLSFLLPPPAMRMNSMVSRTGWNEHAIIDPLGRFQVPREEQWPKTSNSDDCCWHACQKSPNSFQPSMTSYKGNGDCNSSNV